MPCSVLKGSGTWFIKETACGVHVAQRKTPRRKEGRLLVWYKTRAIAAACVLILESVKALVNEGVLSERKALSRIKVKYNGQICTHGLYAVRITEV